MKHPQLFILTLVLLSAMYWTSIPTAFCEKVSAPQVGQDVDNDGLPNDIDPDVDGDGIINPQDPEPYTKDPKSAPEKHLTVKDGGMVNEGDFEDLIAGADESQYGSSDAETPEVDSENPETYEDPGDFFTPQDETTEGTISQSDNY